MKKRTIVLFQAVTGRENKKAKQQAAGYSRAAADTFQFTKSNYMQMQGAPLLPPAVTHLILTTTMVFESLIHLLTVNVHRTSLPLLSWQQLIDYRICPPGCTATCITCKNKCTNHRSVLNLHIALMLCCWAAAGATACRLLSFTWNFYWSFKIFQYFNWGL